MFSESAELYDAIYSTFKDYGAESAAIAALIRGLHPNARTVLDVACGTGEHAKRLHESHGLDVDGLDLDAGLLAVARTKMPNAQFFQADMSAFSLNRRYDVVMCLFSSIGYLKTLDRVTEAFRCFRSHLNEGGVVIVEPWFAPGVLRIGRGSDQHATVGSVHVTRTSDMAIEGTISTLVFSYEIQDGENVRQTKETHELGLFTPAEMLGCFEAAGLSASHDPIGLTDRGLYTARL